MPYVLLLGVHDTLQFEISCKGGYKPNSPRLVVLRRTEFGKIICEKAFLNDGSVLLSVCNYIFLISTNIWRLNVYSMLMLNIIQNNVNIVATLLCNL